MVLWTPTLEEFKKGIHEDRGIDHEVYLKFVQDLKDGKIDLITGGTFYDAVKEAFLGFGKEPEEEEEEKPKEQEFTVVLQEGDRLELTDIEEQEGSEDGNNGEDEENDEKEDDESTKKLRT